MASIRRSDVRTLCWVCFVVVHVASILEAIKAHGSNTKTCYFGPPPQPVPGEHWMQTAAREIRRRCQGAYVCPEEKPLGMEDGRISDDSITASSYYNNKLDHGPLRARLNTEGYATAWCKGISDCSPWIQVEFNAPVYITGLITQGRGEDGWGEQRVTKYQAAYSSDSQNWSHVTDASENAIVFPGNVERNSTVTNRFKALRTRFVRILPIEWISHCSMRFEVLGCYTPK